MQIPFDGPDEPWLSARRAAKYLGLTPAEFARYLKEKNFPRGRRRKTHQFPQWTARDVAWMRYLLEEEERFSGPDEPLEPEE